MHVCKYHTGGKFIYQKLEYLYLIF